MPLARSISNLGVSANLYGLYRFWTLSAQAPEGPARSTDYARERSPGSRPALCDRCGQDHTELGWKPRYSFGQGLEATVRWYLDHLDWYQQVRDQAG